jgi:hypothetical protein
MTVKLRVNDACDGIFYFDTGSPTSVLDWNFVKKANVRTEGKDKLIPIDGIGEGGGKKAEVIKKVVFGFEDNRISCNLVSVTNLNQLSGSKGVDGIIGLDFFSDKTIEINFDENKIYVYDTETDVVKQDYEPVKSIVQHFLQPKNSAIKSGNNDKTKKLYVFIETQVNNELKITGYTLFDTGWSSHLALHTSTAKEAGLTKFPPLVEVEMYGLGFGFGKTTSCILPVPSVKIAGNELGNVLLDYSKDIKGSRNPDHASSRKIIGQIGLKIIQNFNWILDLKADKIYTKPNENIKKRDLLIDSVSIYNIKIHQDNNVFFVHQMLTNQPELTGVSVGDTIQSVYNITTEQDIPLVLLKDSISDYMDIPLEFTFRKNNATIQKRLMIQRKVFRNSKK